MSNEKIVFLDTETTGLSPIRGGHRIIEIACIEYVNNHPTGMVLTSLIDPEGKRVTKDAYKVHGIPNTKLINQPKFGQLADRLLEFLSDAVLVIFNADFDVSFIEQEFKRLHRSVSLEHHCRKIICAQQLAKEMLKVPNISLENACRRYHIDISARIKHGAIIDAQLLADLYFKLRDPQCTPLSRTPQKNPHSGKQKKLITIPRAYRDPVSGNLVQLNFCKNPACENYGVPAKNPSRKKGKGLSNSYGLTLSRDKATYNLRCKLCKQTSILINNRAFVEERNRVLSRLQMKEPGCPNTGMAADKAAGIPNGICYKKVRVQDTNGKTVYERIAKPACSNAGLGIYTHPELYKKDGYNSEARTWAFAT